MQGEGEIGRISKFKMGLDEKQMFYFLSELQHGGLPADLFDIPSTVTYSSSEVLNLALSFLPFIPVLLFLPSFEPSLKNLITLISFNVFISWKWNSSCSD